MNCPKCNNANAYVGLNVVECVNVSCEHYNEEHAVKETPMFVDKKAMEAFNRQQFDKLRELVKDSGVAVWTAKQAKPTRTTGILNKSSSGIELDYIDTLKRNMAVAVQMPIDFIYMDFYVDLIPKSDEEILKQDIGFKVKLDC